MTDKNINIEYKNPLLLVIVSLYWQLYCNFILCGADSDVIFVIILILKILVVVLFIINNGFIFIGYYYLLIY